MLVIEHRLPVDRVLPVSALHICLSGECRCGNVRDAVLYAQCAECDIHLLRHCIAAVSVLGYAPCSITALAASLSPVTTRASGPRCNALIIDHEAVSRYHP